MKEIYLTRNSPWPPKKFKGNGLRDTFELHSLVGNKKVVHNLCFPSSGEYSRKCAEINKLLFRALSLFYSNVPMMPSHIPALVENQPCFLPDDFQNLFLKKSSQFVDGCFPLSNTYHLNQSNVPFHET